MFATGTRRYRLSAISPLCTLLLLRACVLLICVFAYLLQSLLHTTACYTLLQPELFTQSLDHHHLLPYTLLAIFTVQDPTVTLSYPFYLCNLLDSPGYDIPHVAQQFIRSTPCLLP